MTTPPDRLRAGDHPSLLLSAGGIPSARKITVQPAMIDVSKPGEPEGWGLSRTSAKPRTYEFAPDAPIFLSSRLSGLPQADDNDLARPSWQQFVSYARRNPASVEVFFTLDPGGRITMLYELYHP